MTYYIFSQKSIKKSGLIWRSCNMLLNSKWSELHTIAYPSVSTQVIEIDLLKKTQRILKLNFESLEG